MAGNGYREQRAMELVIACYDLTQSFPDRERYGLAAQLQRAAVSVPANIAEGQARQHAKEFLQYLAIAKGSLAELETHIQIAERLGYVDGIAVQEILSRTDHVARMITGLRRSLRARNPQPTTHNSQPSTHNLPPS